MHTAGQIAALVAIILLAALVVGFAIASARIVWEELRESRRRRTRRL